MGVGLNLVKKNPKFWGSKIDEFWQSPTIVHYTTPLLHNGLSVGQNHEFVPMKP
jgi:hypothetical protein